MKRISLIVIAAAGLSGCDFEAPADKRGREYADLRLQMTKEVAANCVKAGGIPSFSGWDGSIKDCKMLSLNSATLPGVLLESQVCTARTCVTVKDVRP